MQDFETALREVKPAFGAVTETLETYRANGIIPYGERFDHLQSTCRTLVEQVRPANQRPHSVLIMTAGSSQHTIALWWSMWKRRCTSPWHSMPHRVIAVHSCVLMNHAWQANLRLGSI